MTFGVTDKGFIQKMFSDIISSIETKGKKYYGADWSLDQYSPEGAIMYVFAYELAEILIRALELLKKGGR